MRRNLIVALLAIIVAAALAGVLVGGEDSSGDDSTASTSALRRSTTAEVRIGSGTIEFNSDRSVGRCVLAEGAPTEEPLGDCEVRYQLSGGAVAARGLVRLEQGEASVIPVIGGTGDYSASQGTITLALSGDFEREIRLVLELLTPG